MPETDERDDKNFHEDTPPIEHGFFLKGSGQYDWGMKNRLARIFRPETGRTVMLAFDHGYFQGPTTGLERIDLSIVPLAAQADALMLTRGILRSTIPATHRGGIVMRASGGPSILRELSDEHIALVQDGAAGVDMGRNIFQSEHPSAMLEAVTKVVHEDLAPAEAFALYESLAHEPVAV